jgi:hypothetical protein
MRCAKETRCAVAPTTPHACLCNAHIKKKGLGLILVVWPRVIYAPWRGTCNKSNKPKLGRHEPSKLSKSLKFEKKKHFFFFSFFFFTFQKDPIRVEVVQWRVEAEWRQQGEQRRHRLQIVRIATTVNEKTM